ncbi:MAG TPA: thiamine pyrophosphate-dependent enzyme, partial [Actinomycetota bacterium]
DASDAGRALAAGQFLVGDAAWLARHRPEVVLQVGATPTTRATQALVAAADDLVVLDRDHLDPDPEHRAAERIDVDPELFAAVAWDDREDLGSATADPAWLEGWRAADLVARAALDRFLDARDEPFEPRVARDLAAFVPHGATLFVGSSTPVRDLDLAMTPRRPPRLWTAPDLVRILANRGASGIDGSIATALGAAAAGGRPVYALLGDLTFLYDVGTLAWLGRRDLHAVLVIMRNGGGEIFSLLPQLDLPEHRDLFVTPHGFDGFGDLCASLGVGHAEVTRSAELGPALERAAKTGGIQVVEVAIDPVSNRERRAELRGAVTSTLAGR